MSTSSTEDNNPGSVTISASRTPNNVRFYCVIDYSPLLQLSDSRTITIDAIILYYNHSKLALLKLNLENTLIFYARDSQLFCTFLRVLIDV